MRQRIDDIIFDCDSTLSRIEGIDEVAALSGHGERVAQLTTAAMNGEIPLERVYGERLNIIRPTLRNVLTVAERYAQTEVTDARAVISHLLAGGKQIFVVSGGIYQAVLPFAKSLGISEQNVCAVHVLFDRHGSYTGFAASPLTTSTGKAEVIRGLRVSGRTAMLVGDGTSDLAAKHAVDLFVGFGGVVSRPAVRAGAQVFLEGPSLLPLLDLIA